MVKLEEFYNDTRTHLINVPESQLSGQVFEMMVFQDSYFSESCSSPAKINQDPAAIFANNNLFTGTDIKLSLRGNLIKTSATGIPLDCNNCQSVSGICTDLLICNNQSAVLQISGFQWSV